MLAGVDQPAEALTIAQAAAYLNSSRAWISVLLKQERLLGPVGGPGAPRVWRESLVDFDRSGRKKPGRPRKSLPGAAPAAELDGELQRRLDGLENEIAASRQAALEIKVVADSALDELETERRSVDRLEIEVATLRAQLRVQQRGVATERKARQTYSEALNQFLVPGSPPSGL